jgi:hypothetical protein
LAESRATEVLPWLAGHYTLKNGESFVIDAKGRGSNPNSPPPRRNLY